MTFSLSLLVRNVMFQVSNSLRIVSSTALAALYYTGMFS